jgi:hypothetical protein
MKVVNITDLDSQGSTNKPSLKGTNISSKSETIIMLASDEAG